MVLELRRVYSPKKLVCHLFVRGCACSGCCWNQSSPFFRWCCCGILQSVVEGSIPKQTSHASTPLCRIFSAWRLITRTLLLSLNARGQNAKQTSHSAPALFLNVLGYACFGHDVSPAALNGFGWRGKLALPAASSGDTHPGTHPPTKPGAAAGDRNVSRPEVAASSMSSRKFGMWKNRK